MNKSDLELIELSIKLQANKKAEELGITYDIKARTIESCLNVLVPIQRGHKNNSIFAHFIGKMIADKYKCSVRFTYPDNL